MARCTRRCPRCHCLSLVLRRSYQRAPRRTPLGLRSTKRKHSDAPRTSRCLDRGQLRLLCMWQGDAMICNVFPYCERLGQMRRTRPRRVCRVQMSILQTGLPTWDHYPLKRLRGVDCFALLPSPCLPRLAPLDRCCAVSLSKPFAAGPRGNRSMMILGLSISFPVVSCCLWFPGPFQLFVAFLVLDPSG